MTQLYLEDLRLFELESLDLEELADLEIERPAITTPEITTFTCKVGEGIEEVPWVFVGQTSLIHRGKGQEMRKSRVGAYLPAITNCRLLNKNRSVVGIHR
jgi:hypothetical protein